MWSPWMHRLAAWIPAAGVAAVTVCCGTADSSSTVVAPSIVTQPAALTLTEGGSGTLSVVASGGGTLAYQWYKTRASIPGATASSYTITSATAATAGSYFVTVTNSAGSVTSNTVAVTVVSAAPAIRVQPVPTTVTAGGRATLSVIAGGGVPLGYQWYKDGVPIAGADASSCTLDPVTAADAGSYHVVVSNGDGTVASEAVLLTVTLAAAGR